MYAFLSNIAIRVKLDTGAYKMVVYGYAKGRRLYGRLEILDKTVVEFFNDSHT